MYRSVVAVAVFSLLLSACAASSIAPYGDSVSPATPDPALPLPEEPVVADLPSANEADTPIVLDPSRLLDRTPSDIQALLGDPSLVRRDDKVQTMLFERAACVFDLTFVAKDVGSGFYLHHLASRDRLGASVDDLDCLMAVLADRDLNARLVEALAKIPEPPPAPAEPPSDSNAPNGTNTGRLRNG